PEWAPPRTLEQYATAAEVEALTEPPPGEGWLYVWAWEDEAAGRVRARAFPRRTETGRTQTGRTDTRGSRSGGTGTGTGTGSGADPGGIEEDEATGAAAMLLSARLGRALNIAQGRG
ncbi:hypothetical protein H5I60_33595, partial [Streptomyces griseolus]|nr:hypothetical protein [Streptomyces griseolus]